MSARSRSKSPARNTPTKSSKSTAADAGDAEAVASPWVAWLRPRVLHVVLTVIVGGTVAAVEVHRRETGVFNVWQALLAFFLILNSFIAVMELQLHFGAALVAKRSVQLSRRFKNNKLQGGGAWFTTPLTRNNVFQEAWTDMWSSYTLFDPCYNDDGTFGFWIDSGNGVLTLLPSLALLYNLTFDVAALAPKWMALLSVAVFWTELWGTVLYAWGFFYRRQHEQIGWFHTFLFVFCTNGIWFFVPAIAIYLMTGVIESNSFAAFRV